MKDLIYSMVSAIVDQTESIMITEEETEKGTLYLIKVSKDDVGKIIGKKGRIASSIRTVVKAAAAKNGLKVMVNVFNKPLE